MISITRLGAEKDNPDTVTSANHWEVTAFHYTWCLGLIILTQSMEDYIESLQGIAMEYEHRPVWDKLGENDPSNQDIDDFEKYLNKDDQKPS